MKLSIIAIGRMKSGPEQALLARYQDRANGTGKSLGLGPVSVVEIPESRAGSAASRKREEADRIASACTAGAAVICLDEAGKDWTSQSFADSIARYRDDGAASVTFVIGGADGLDPDFRAQHATLRFGQMTLPHQIARIVLMEQIYRATTILSGHPYHRA